jgi:hypothetical protein
VRKHKSSTDALVIFLESSFFFCISSCPFCPPGIGPPGSSGFNTPGGGGNPDGDNGDDECTTTTTQDCASLCTADATPSSTQTCSAVVGCEPTPTSTGTTIITPIGITLTVCHWYSATVDSPASLSSIAGSQSSILSSTYANDPHLNSSPEPLALTLPQGPLGDLSRSPVRQLLRRQQPLCRRLLRRQPHRRSFSNSTNKTF